MRVTVYTKPGCHLCDEVLLLVDKLSPRYGIELVEVNIIEDMGVYEEYKHLIPVVEVKDVSVGRLVAPIDEVGLRGYFEKARRVMEREGVGVLGRVAKWFGGRRGGD